MVLFYLLGKRVWNIKVVLKELKHFCSNGLGIFNLVQSILASPDAESKDRITLLLYDSKKKSLLQIYLTLLPVGGDTSYSKSLTTNATR